MIDGRDIVASTSRNIPHVRYRTHMLSFLAEQLSKLERCNSVSDKLRATIRAGEELVQQHAAPFDLVTFYRTADVRETVESICSMLQDSVGSPNKDVHAQVETRVPDLDFEEDRRVLGAHRRFVLSIAESLVSDARHAYEWREAQGKHMAQMRNVLLVHDDEVEMQESVCIGRSAEYCVYRGMWRGIPVAVKKLNRTEDGQEPDINLRAQLLAEAGSMVVTEFALEDLVNWHSSHKNVSWQVTVSLLHQAALGLAHVHSFGDLLAHGNIRASSFLVFEGDSGVQGLKLKLGDFGLVSIRRDCQSRCQSVGLWQAPEICEQMPRSLSADVYSFGVVMSECLNERMSYGAHGREGDVDTVSEWRKGGPPYQIPLDCPKDLEALMMQCIAPDPMRRPSMYAVQKRLGMM